MIFNLFSPTSLVGLRPSLLFVFCVLLPSCYSEGQSNQDESDYFQRRKIPEYVLEALPKNADTLAHSIRFVFLGHGKLDSQASENMIQKAISLSTKLEALKSDWVLEGKTEWHFYPSAEIKGLMLKNSAPLSIDFENGAIHSIANGYFQNHYTTEGNQLLLRQLLGKPQTPELELGLAIWLDETWQQKGYRTLAAQLKAADGIPPLSELLNSQHWSTCSPLIFGTATACFVDFLIELNGTDDFLEGYPSWIPNEEEIVRLEKGWTLYLEKLEKPGPAPSLKKSNLSYLQGFNFAHEGYRIFNGYGSQKANQALQHLSNMGANAVAIVPYSFLRNHDQPARIPVVKSPGTENDESVITSAEQAQAIGMSVVLKPQIWMGGGQWPGDIVMKSEEDWNKFFHCYRHWIMHYALLAEIYQWEAICMGTEMVQTTLQREVEWKKLFEDVRMIYDGQITYAANWGDEFEKTKIWDDLDFIGINCYYPLSQKDDPSDQELALAFAEVLKKIERVQRMYKKPVVFTEIGFPNIEAPWKKPHEDWGDFQTNEEHQRRCYEIIFRAIENKEWCNGILWWKYPSDLEHRSRRSTGFTPHGKLAEATVEKWFKQKAE